MRRDLDILLLYVSYATDVRDASAFEDRCLNGLRETHLALGVPGASVAEGVRKIKEEAIARPRPSAEPPPTRRAATSATPSSTPSSAARSVPPTR